MAAAEQQALLEVAQYEEHLPVLAIISNSKESSVAMSDTSAHVSPVASTDTENQGPCNIPTMQNAVPERFLWFVIKQYVCHW